MQTITQAPHERRRVDWHQAHVDAQASQEKPQAEASRSWGQWAYEVAPSVGLGLAAAGTVAYGAMQLRKRQGEQVPAAGLHEALPQPQAHQRAFALNAVNRIVQPEPDVNGCRYPYPPDDVNPALVERLRSILRGAGGIQHNQAALHGMPAPQNTAQRLVLKAQDNAVDAAAAAGVGAAVGAVVGGPVGALIGIAAGGLIAALGGEMRGR